MKPISAIIPATKMPVWAGYKGKTGGASNLRVSAQFKCHSNAQISICQNLKTGEMKIFFNLPV
jgi:hypothetical protein